MSSKLLKTYYERHFQLYPPTNASPNTLLVFFVSRNLRKKMLVGVNGSLQENMFQIKFFKAQTYNSKEKSTTVNKKFTILIKNLLSEEK